MQNMEACTPSLLFENHNWWVVSKPSGWLCIPGRTSHQGSAPPVLVEWLRTTKSSPVWVTHRIDRETSGIVLFAKTQEAHAQANAWFQQRKVKKVYRCLAVGRLGFPLLKINEPIEGAPSSTQVECVEQYSQGFLARVYPRTGRRHQIRIHMARQGFALLGDSLYGGPKELRLKDQSILTIQRVALHASSLELPTGERFECTDPEDFIQWMDTLRKDQ